MCIQLCLCTSASVRCSICQASAGVPFPDPLRMPKPADNEIRGSGTCNSPNTTRAVLQSCLEVLMRAGEASSNLSRPSQASRRPKITTSGFWPKSQFLAFWMPLKALQFGRPGSEDQGLPEPMGSEPVISRSQSHR